jgi:predicted NAD/FAD-binding protein
MGNMKSTPNTRIAVVGSGIAGLGAAWALSNKYQVTLYERDPVLGGHARTLSAPHVAGGVPVDVGVFILHEMLYTNLFALFERLGIETCATTTGVTMWSKHGDNQWHTHFQTPMRRRLEPELNRFKLAIPKIVGNLRAHLGTTLNQYLDRNGYSDDFRNLVIAPCLASVFSTGADFMEAPVIGIALCFQPVPLLSPDAATSWRTVTHGVKSYVDAMARSIPDVRLNSAVSRITRSRDAVCVVDEHGGQEEYNQVVIATEADNALRMLADPSPEEEAMLSPIRYDRSRIVAHTDRRVMPDDERLRATFGYVVNGERAGKQSAYYVYHLNDIQPRIPSEVDVFTTVNPPDGLIDPASIFADIVWTHLVFDGAQAARTLSFHEIQGCNRTWFCGEHTASLGHEGSFVSGLAVAKAIGADYPFEHQEPARSSFYDVAAFMMRIVPEAEAGLPAGLWPPPLGRIMRQLEHEDQMADLSR